MSVTTKKLLAVGLLALMLIAALLAWLHFAPQAQTGDKTVALEVTHGDGSVVRFDIRTDAQSLRDALEQEGLIAGEESAYGLYVLTVDGETADEALRQWWCFTKGGEQLNTGVDDTLIADGEQYEAALSVY